MNVVNKDIIAEKIKYLSRMPHSSLVEYCIYLENEKETETEKLKSIINKAIEYIDTVKTLAEVDKVNILSISSLEKILQGKSE